MQHNVFRKILFLWGCIGDFSCLFFTVFASDRNLIAAGVVSELEKKLVEEHSGDKRSSTLDFFRTEKQIHIIVLFSISTMLIPQTRCFYAPCLQSECLPKHRISILFKSSWTRITLSFSHLPSSRSFTELRKVWWHLSIRKVRLLS